MGVNKVKLYLRFTRFLAESSAPWHMRQNPQNVSRKIDIITFYNLKIKNCLKVTKKYYKTNEQKNISKLTLTSTDYLQLAKLIAAGSMETYHLSLVYSQLIQRDFTESGIRNSKIFRH